MQDFLNNKIYPINPLGYYDSLGLLGQCADGNCGANGESLVDSAWKKIKGAFPSSKEGWADYLGKQADIFGVVSVGMASSAVLAPAAPVAAVIGSAADAGAKMLKPPANIVHATDTVLDIAGAGAPGGFFKDAGLTALKKVI
ncbi:hypothetical protein [Paracidovorax sp. MALMAid1276]|uniref:hypothetical protein n=1 Tax=Paracidovorax sp. MALMAid1276 TaxID=3411631 RepID=UPI003B9CEA78